MIDLEFLLVTTAAKGDTELLHVAVSWLAMHHVLVFGRRLAGLASALAVARPREAAVLGTVLDRAHADALMLSNDSRLLPESLEIARRRCGTRPVDPRMRTRIESVRRVSAVANDAAAAHDRPRPVSWLVENVPELRVRALIGATLEAEIMTAVLASARPSTGPTVDDVPAATVRAISRHAGVSYAGAHAAANRLARRGLLVRSHQARRLELHPTPMALAALGWPAPASGRC